MWDIEYDPFERKFEEDLIEPITREYFSGEGMPRELRRYLERKYIIAYCHPNLFPPAYERAVYDCRKYIQGRIGLRDNPSHLWDAEPQIPEEGDCIGPDAMFSLLADIRVLMMEVVFLRYALSLNMKDPGMGKLLRDDIFSSLPSLVGWKDYDRFVETHFNGIDPLDNEGFSDLLFRLSCGQPVEECPSSYLIHLVNNSFIDYEKIIKREKELLGYEDEDEEEEDVPCIF